MFLHRTLKRLQDQHSKVTRNTANKKICKTSLENMTEILSGGKASVFTPERLPF